MNDVTHAVPQPIPLESLDLRHVHFVGIGGAGQSALAHALLDMGKSVSGSDWKLSAVTTALAGRGATIHVGHSADNIPPGTTLVVTTAAAKGDNPELVEAERRTLKIVKRAQLLGAICNAHKTVIAVAGTHGKTTTTSMIAFLLERAGLAPSYFIGGVSRNLGASGRIGASYAGAGTGIVVVEADEYDRSFLQLTPDIAVITNIEMDHPDYYKDIEEIKEAFYAFEDHMRGARISIYPSLPDESVDENGNVENIFAGCDCGGNCNFPKDTGEPRAWLADHIKPNTLGGHDFTMLWSHMSPIDESECQLAIPGLHNVTNVLGALAAIEVYAELKELDEIQILTQVVKNLPQFVGAERRFEVKGEAAGVTVVDDYAHHPTEVRATLAGARARYPTHRIVALFQPHTYSRTRGLLHDFAASFDDADALALMPIFAAREVNTDGVSSEDVIEAIVEHKVGVGRPLPQDKPQLISPTALDAAQAVETLTAFLQPGDVLLTLGAGDVWQVGVAVLERLREPNPHPLP